jgi:hypothetical protein
MAIQDFRAHLALAQQFAEMETKRNALLAYSAALQEEIKKIRELEGYEEIISIDEKAHTDSILDAVNYVRDNVPAQVATITEEVPEVIPADPVAPTDEVSIIPDVR